MSSSRPSSIRHSKSPPLPQSTRSPREAPLPHFEDDEPPAPQADEREPVEQDNPEDDENDIPYPEPSSDQTLLPPPNFNPFFTIIEDTTSGEHYHPYVHYVFADDDPVILTAAAMRSLGLDDTQYLPQTTPEGEGKQLNEDRGDDEQREQQPHESHVESPLPPPIPGVKERYIILDVAPDGHTIEDAQSLSSEWQITNANVRTAPSFDEESSDQGYMLRIEGVEIPGKSRGKNKGEPGELKLKEAKDREQGDVFAAMDGLVKGIEGSLGVAGKIIGSREDDVRESEQTVLSPGTIAGGGGGAGSIDEKGKGRTVETCDF